MGKRKVFKTVRIEPSGGEPIVGPSIARQFTLDQIEARKRYAKTKRKGLSWRQYQRKSWEVTEDLR